MVSRPKCMTSLKTCHFSSQLTRGVNNRGQFICVRYLPNAALMLVLKSCLMEIFLLLMLRFSGSVEMCLLSQQPSWQRRSWIYESHYWCTAVWCRRMRKKCPNQSPLILNHEHVLLFPIIPMFDNSRFPVNISGSMFDFTRTQTWFFNVLFIMLQNHLILHLILLTQPEVTQCYEIVTHYPFRLYNTYCNYGCL